MSHLWRRIALCLLVLSLAQPARGIEPEELRRGLVATYRDAAKPTPTEVARLEPQIALALAADEAPHPRLRTDGGGVAWRGYVNILRRGSYRFGVRLRGRFRLKIAGKEVLIAEVKDEKPVLLESAFVTLEAGVHPLLAEFTRFAGVARVEVFWEAKHFRQEPLSFDHLGHLSKEMPPRLTADTLAERGRYLVEESACVRCHQSMSDNRAAKRLISRMGPDLSQVGRRVRADWLMRWLESPRKMCEGAAMPEMFAADEEGRVERYAVTRYLVSLGGPLKMGRPPDQREWNASAARGERMFNSIGCTACHGVKRQEDSGRAFVFAAPVRDNLLSGLGSKTTAERLTEYLKNPLAIDPSGRMPHMLLHDGEARDLARFLCKSKIENIGDELTAAPATDQMLAAFRRVDDRPDELSTFKQLPADRQWLELGKRVVIEKGCNNCHTIAPQGKPFASMRSRASLEDLMQPPKQDGGCLARHADKRGRVPRFDFSVRDRAAIKAFLREGLQGAGSSAPAYTARADIERFNCLACHSRDGDGGLSAAMLEQLRRYEKAENAEAVNPPPLTGIGHKLRTSWLRQVLTRAGRARPWMGLRMPQFGAANVGKLPEGLAALEGAAPDDTIHKTPLTATKIEAGRFLAGKSAFGCISCHDIAGIANRGTRGPDLAHMTERVRHNWYLRWLEQPQRMQPGTRMPSVFLNGKSLLEKLLDGSAEKQADALWAYLSLGRRLPLPDGLGPPEGLTVAVDRRPVLLRTFMPDAGSRAVAIGFPGGVSAAFDAHTCRLAYAWSGNFLDASPIWNDRGGNPARLLGPRFWTAPLGCPIGVTSGDEPPDFRKRAKDPAYGGPMPEGKLYLGPVHLQFEGYSIDKGAAPILRYRMQSSGEENIWVSERIGPLRSPAGVGLARQFRIRAKADRVIWLLAGQTNGTPRLLDGKGTPVKCDEKASKLDVPIADRMLVLPDGDRLVVLKIASAPKKSQWRLERRDGLWQVLLRTAPSRSGEVRIELQLWAPYGDEPALLRELK